MDIAGLSMMLSQYKVQNAVGTSVLKMAMDTSKENAAAMTGMIKESTRVMENLAQPYLGKKLDVKV